MEQQAQGFLPDLGRPYSDSDVARMLGISISAVRRDSKRLGVIRIRRKYIFFEVPLLAALKNMVNLSLESSLSESSPYPLLDFMAIERGGSEESKGDMMEDRHGLLA